jgi:GTP cyclohydrolase II
VPATVISIAEHSLVTECGAFRNRVYITGAQQQTVFALYRRGRAGEDNAAPLRVQFGCTTGPTFRSLDCDCAAQITAALRIVAEQECGCLLYFRDQEAFGLGVALKARVVSAEESDGRAFVDAEGIGDLRARVRVALLAVPEILTDLRAELFGDTAATPSYTLLGDSKIKYRELLRLGVPIKDVIPLTIDKDGLTTRAIHERMSKRSRNL